MTKQLLVYGLPKGETEWYMEDLLASSCRDQADVAKVKAAASKDGWQ